MLIKVCLNKTDAFLLVNLASQMLTYIRTPSAQNNPIS